MIKVSIIVPVYNTFRYLEECLDSLVNQTYPNMEIILINDGSTDDSAKIINDYQKKYKNIMVINSSNHGQGYARNLGLKKATGEYITFVDSDDYISLDMISKMVNSIKDSDIVICDMYEVINQQNIYYQHHFNFKNDQINFMLSNPGPVAKLYNKKVLKDVWFMENVYYEDLAFTIKLSLNVKKVAYLKEALYYYNIHQDSTMRKKDYNPKIDSIFKVMDYLDSVLKDYPKELEYLYIEHLLYSATLRYLEYDNCRNQLLKINNLMHRYPNWKKNDYYRLKSKKFKLVCRLSYLKQYGILKLLKKVSGK